ncbi:Hypothetical predicted protein [Cloeon dipterum]|uniref:Uncharacterized protein n=1 Tax=Cloeon dipterum TaxID=197152 RepID=A0A8S1DI30_9INSE|nr:Hypothetical predicted protein [Cloeon dipterum]
MYIVQPESPFLSLAQVGSFIPFNLLPSGMEEVNPLASPDLPKWRRTRFKGFLYLIKRERVQHPLFPSRSAPPAPLIYRHAPDQLARTARLNNPQVIKTKAALLQIYTII